MLSFMTDDNFWNKDFFKEKENRKKVGKAGARGGLGYIALAFFMGYIFLQPLVGGSQVDAGFAFAVFCFLSLIYAFFGLFTGVYFIFFLPNWYSNALNLVGFSDGIWLTWIGFYPIVFIGCLINFGLIVFLAFKLIKWIIQKIR